MTSVERGGKIPIYSPPAERIGIASYTTVGSNIYPPRGDRRGFDNSFVKKAAFTLPEILITIGVIGIVAALTLPNLISRIENQMNLSKLKRAYADLHIFLEDFNTTYDCYNDLDFCAGQPKEFVEKFSKYLVESRQFSYVNSKSVKRNNSSPLGQTGNNYLPFNSYSVTSPRGYTYLLDVNVDDSSENPYYSKLKNYGRIRAVLWIVTDNHKMYAGNLVTGRNVYKAHIMAYKRIIPGGSTSACPAYFCRNYKITKTCHPDETPTEQPNRLGGWGCLARIIDEGWKMNY